MKPGRCRTLIGSTKTMSSQLNLLSAEKYAKLGQTILTKVGLKEGGRRTTKK
jgi:hypothetical protein